MTRCCSEAALAIAAHVRNEHGEIVADLPPQAVEVLRSDSRDTIYYVVRGPRGELISGDQDLPVSGLEPSLPAYRDAIYRGHPIRIAIYATLIDGAAVTIAVA
jgi:two-component system sensor histidine kinase TctE